MAVSRNVREWGGVMKFTRLKEVTTGEGATLGGDLGCRGKRFEEGVGGQQSSSVSSWWL